MKSLEFSPPFPAHAIDDELRVRLLAYPNVTDVSIGLRMKAGVFTSEQVIVVFVSRKIPVDRLPKEALLPNEVAGLPIDVQTELDPSLLTISEGTSPDRTRTRPLQPGLAIATSSAPDALGSLGCFATRNSDQKKVLVSNYHILFRNRDLVVEESENRVYQPLVERHNQIATVPEGTGSVGGSLDCAFAILNEEGSCCCCTSTIPHENKVGDTRLVGVATAQVDQKVFKTGARTGSTVGKVVNVDKDISGSVDYSEFFLPAGDTFNFSNLIRVVFWDEENEEIDLSRPFTQGGDSGSIIYNENNEIIGLHFLSYFDPDTDRHFSFACHVELVENSLGLTIPGTRNYTSAAPGALPPSLAAIDDPATSDNVLIAGTSDPGQADLHHWWQQIEPQLSRIESGKKALALFKLHSYEIMRLINHTREVTVTWHRGKGPSFVAAIARSIRHEDYQIPRAIDGVSATDLTSRMAFVLKKYGSAELQEAIETYLPLFLQVVEELESARELVPMIAEIDALQATQFSIG